MTRHLGEHAGEPLGSSEPRQIGPYKLIAHLGSGAMGRVHLGVDEGGRRAAVKVVRADLAEVPAFRKRFARELDVARRVHGAHIAEIYDADPDTKVPWLATEYVPGPTLQDAIDQSGALDTGRLRALASAIADALATIHAADVVHRDLKPSNVLLGPDGPKVIDFGVARAIDASLLTNTGQTLGTPAYMSPEQADGRSVEGPSDVFALGSLLAFAATGRLAFGDGPPLAILHRVVNNEPDLTWVARDDEPLRDLIISCLAKNPEDRPTPRQIIEACGATRWEPLQNVAWQAPVADAGMTGLPGADDLTVRMNRRRPGKRIALVSAAAVAAVVIAAVAVAEGSGDSGTTSGSVRAGNSMSASGASGSSSSSSSASGATVGGPMPSGAASVAPGGPASSTQSAQSQQNPQPASAPGSTGTANPGSKTTGAPPSHSTTAQPSTSQTSVPAPTSQPAPAHNPPGPVTDGSIYIPGWFGEATIDVSWSAIAGATSYDVHYTNDWSGGPVDKTVRVTQGTSFSFAAPAGSTSCVELRSANQYGVSAWTGTTPHCFDTSGNPK